MEYFERYVSMCHYTEKLKSIIKKHENKESYRELNTEIGVLKSEIDYLNYKLDKAKKEITLAKKKKEEDVLLQKIRNQKKQINNLLKKLEK